MKRTTFSLLTALLLTMAAGRASGQLWLMTDGSYFFAKNTSGVGINARAAWHFGDYDYRMFNEYNMVTLGFGYNFLPGSQVNVVLTDTLGNFDTLQTSLTATLFTIDADYRRYFAETDADDHFGFYGLAGISAWMVGTKVTAPVPEDTTFFVPETTKLVSTNMSIRLPIGVGIDWTIRGRFWWYIEAKMEVPITQVNDDWIGSDFGTSFHIATGARIPIWEVW